MIDIKNLHMDYGNGKGVSDINLSIKPGEVKGLLGPNGSGKSTTMRSYLGFLKIQDGRCYANGVDILSDPTQAKNFIGYLPGDPQLPQNMTPRVLFSISSNVRSVSTDYANELSEAFDLDASIKVKELSKGNRQKAALILALLHKPKVIVLDEPTSGLDPFHQRTFFELIDTLATSGSSILLSSHIVTEIEKVSSSIAVLKDGKKIYDNSLNNFKSESEAKGMNIEEAFFDFFKREGANNV